MSAPKINLGKFENDENDIKEPNFSDKDIDTEIPEMQERISEFCKNLLDKDVFNVEQSIDYLVQYIHDCHRILYSAFSNQIYAYYESHNSKEASQTIGTMLTHIEKLIAYTKTESFSKKMELSSDPTDYTDTSKALIKIWDHVSLAAQQYSMLKSSDEEYNQKIDTRLIPFQKELSKEMNTQLLTMIGIFTALAFILFGGISSLENLFANSSMPVFKFMVVGCIWSLCLLDLIYVFLYCIGKMSNLSSDLSQNDLNIFQRYAIIWWSNYVLVAIMLLSLWAYCLDITNNYGWFEKIFVEHSLIFTIIIAAFILLFGYILSRKTQKEK